MERIDQVISYRPRISLADQHSTSRPTVRRALRELRLRGLIETRQGSVRLCVDNASVSITLVAENYRRHQREGQAVAANLNRRDVKAPTSPA